MSFSCLHNNRGLTITELVVAMGIASILLVFVVSGSLFVQDYLQGWRHKDIIWEELVYLQRDLTELIASSRYRGNGCLYDIQADP